MSFRYGRRFNWSRAAGEFEKAGHGWRYYGDDMALRAPSAVALRFAECPACGIVPYDGRGYQEAW